MTWEILLISCDLGIEVGNQVAIPNFEEKTAKKTCFWVLNRENKSKYPGN